MNARTFVAVAARVIMATLAVAHTFPARKHLALLAVQPSFDEAWKGIGSAVAVALFLLPPRSIARIVGRVWRHRRAVLAVAGWVLAIVHLVPAADHVPRLIASGAWGDAWRGIGALVASAWFVAPVPTQAAMLARIREASMRLELAGWTAAQRRWSVLEPRSMSVTAAIVTIGLVLGAGSGAVAARAERNRSSRLTAPDSIELPVPHAAGPIAIDGELDDDGWTAVARTGAFTRDRAEARPYSEARMTWRNGTLFVMLYAADEDLRGGDPADPEHGPADTFRVVMQSPKGDYEIRISPDRFRAWGAPDFADRVRVAHDNDGSLDDGADDDEEWVVELAIPLDALGLRGETGERLGIAIERCDTVRPRPGAAGGRRCSSWGTDRRGVITLR